MTSNLFDMVTDEFRGDVVDRMSGVIGESAPATQTALSSAVPAILGGLMKKGATTSGASDLLGLMKEHGCDGSQTLNAATAALEPNGLSGLIQMGAPLLSGLFGSRADSVAGWVASRAGIKKPAASSLLGMAAPIVLSMLGRRVSADGWNVSSLMNVLGSLTGNLSDLPAGLAGVLGMSSPTEREEYIPAAARLTAPPVTERTPIVERTPARVETVPYGSGSSWWKWAIPLAALLALLPFIRNWMAPSPVVERTAGSRETVTPAPTPPEPVATIERVEPTRRVEMKLPTGVDLNLSPNGVESKLLAFIRDPNRPADKTTWFSFDRLEFETASAALKSSSVEQLRDVAAILKAYPQVALKIGGYTDNVGDPTSNLKLSGQRAKATMQQLVKLGIEPSRLAAEGYGEQFPIATNSTAEGRQRNRRTDIRVTAK